MVENKSRGVKNETTPARPNTGIITVFRFNMLCFEYFLIVKMTLAITQKIVKSPPRSISRTPIFLINRFSFC